MLCLETRMCQDERVRLALHKSFLTLIQVTRKSRHRYRVQSSRNHGDGRCVAAGLDTLGAASRTPEHKRIRASGHSLPESEAAMEFGSPVSDQAALLRIGLLASLE